MKSLTDKKTWTCPGCRATNFANRNACRKCKVPKPADLKPAARATGSGGGEENKKLGEKIFNHLMQMDPTVKKDEYYSAIKGWDITALQEDLTIMCKRANQPIPDFAKAATSHQPAP